MIAKTETKNMFAALCVMMQVALILLQLVMIDVYHMEDTSATNLRVLMAAIPISLAALLTFYRRVGLWVATFGVVLIVMLFHSVMFPSNYPFIWGQGLRFTLPMVVTCALIIVSIGNIRIIDKAMYIVSWFSFAVVIFYAFSFLQGRFFIESYSMSFSYGALLTALTLYSRKRWYSVTSSLIILTIIFIIGSRGGNYWCCIYYA